MTKEMKGVNLFLPWMEQNKDMIQCFIQGQTQNKSAT